MVYCNGVDGEPYAGLNDSVADPAVVGVFDNVITFPVIVDTVVAAARTPAPAVVVTRSPTLIPVALATVISNKFGEENDKLADPAVPGVADNVS